MAVHTIAVPRNPGLFVLFGVWVFLPYIPLVFGPAAIAHGVLFILATNLVRDARANTLLVAGAVGLFAIAAIGATVQIALPFGSWLDGVGYGGGVTFSGLTAAGCIVITRGLARECESRRAPLKPHWIVLRL